MRIVTIKDTMIFRELKTAITAVITTPGEKCKDI
jgi:hypothetical protein